MGENAVELFAEALRDGRPVVLIAGQSFGIAPSGVDTVLDALLGRLGREYRLSGWRAALEGGMTEADMEWLTERFDRSVPSEASLRAFDVAWSGVFTSSIDPQFARRFATRGRQPEVSAIRRHLRAGIAQPLTAADLLLIWQSRRYCRRRAGAEDLGRSDAADCVAWHRIPEPRRRDRDRARRRRRGGV